MAKKKIKPSFFRDEHHTEYFCDPFEGFCWHVDVVKILKKVWVYRDTHKMAMGFRGALFSDTLIPNHPLLLRGVFGLTHLSLHGACSTAQRPILVKFQFEDSCESDRPPKQPPRIVFAHSPQTPCIIYIYISYIYIYHIYIYISYIYISHIYIYYISYQHCGNHCGSSKTSALAASLTPEDPGLLGGPSEIDPQILQRFTEVDKDRVATCWLVSWF